MRTTTGIDHRHAVLGLACHGAGMAADAPVVVDQESILHGGECSQTIRLVELDYTGIDPINGADVDDH